MDSLVKQVEYALGTVAWLNQRDKSLAPELDQTHAFPGSLGTHLD